MVAAIQSRWKYFSGLDNLYLVILGSLFLLTFFLFLPEICFVIRIDFINIDVIDNSFFNFRYFLLGFLFAIALIIGSFLELKKDRKFKSELNFLMERTKKAIKDNEELKRKLSHQKDIIRYIIELDVDANFNERKFKPSDDLSGLRNKAEIEFKKLDETTLELLKYYQEINAKYKNDIKN